MKRVISKIGDVYCVKINDTQRKYFQYIADDITMLNSRVIRIFKKIYSSEDNPDLNKVVKDEIDFYVHLFINNGVKMNLWEKVGNIKELGGAKPLFRISGESGIKSGEKLIEISEKWKVWRINEPMKFVGKLEGENRTADIGDVMPPQVVSEKIWTGKYNMMYPGYDESSFLRYFPTIESKAIMKLIKKATESK
jgi:hypothetical protein